MTGRPALSYFICGVPRSGTTLFAALLAGTGVAGHPREHFAPEYEPEWALYDYAAFVADCVARGCNSMPVFGAKILCDHRPHLVRRLRRLDGSASLTDRAVLERTFPNPRFLWIRRNDVLAQAVSWAKALQTQEWTRMDPDANGTKPSFDFGQVRLLAALVESRNETWARWFAEQRIQPFVTSYEELVADAGGVIRRALEFLGIEYPDDVPIAAWTRRQADGVNADWIARYQALDAARRRRGRRRAWQPPREVTSSYVLCQSARSGGELLTDVLDASGLVGPPQRCVPLGRMQRWRARDYERLLTKRMARHARNGVFGMKVAWGEWDGFLANLRTIPGRESLRGLELLESVFANLRLVWVRRADVLAQAVSWSRASQSGIWASSDAGNGVVPTFDYADLDERVGWLETANDGWRRWFAANGVEPLSVWYEALDADPVGAARRFLGVLGVDVPDDLRIREPQRQHSGADGEWVERYRELERTTRADGA